MIILLPSLYFKIISHGQIEFDLKNNKRINSNNSNIANTTFSDLDYIDHFITTDPDDPVINISECSFSSIIPSSYMSDSSLIYSLNALFLLKSNNFTQCSFTSALFYLEGSNFTMNNNQITSCYNFEQALSIGNIIRCSRTISNIQSDTIKFDDTSHSCRGLYFTECNDTIIRGLIISNSNILRNHGNAIMFFSTTDTKIRCLIESSSFTNCGESDTVIYSMLPFITVNRTNITFSGQTDQKVNGLYFPNIGSYTITKSNFERISGTTITFSDEERVYRPYTIRLQYTTFSGCDKCVNVKHTGDIYRLINFTFSELEFDTTLMTIEGNTECIEFEGVTFSHCPSSKANTNFILKIPENNREFNFRECSISSSLFSSERSCVYFGRTGRYTFRGTHLINMREAGIIFSDEENRGENDSPLEIELLEGTSFSLSDNCVQFNMLNSPISNVLADNLIFQSDLLTFNKSLNRIVIERSNFTKCYSYQGTSILELPNNEELEFVMRDCIFNYTHLLSGTAIEILNSVKTVTISMTQFVDIEGDIFVDVDKHSSSVGSSAGPIRIVDCSFKNSVSSYDGAAIRITSLFSARLFEIDGCLFSNCRSKKMLGGAISFNAIHGRIQRCTFINNVASKGCDIFYNIDKGDDQYFAFGGQSVTIEGNVFERDAGGEGGDGYVSLVYFGLHNFTNLLFHHNKVRMNESLENVYLADCDRTSAKSGARFAIENNCMAGSNKGKIKEPSNSMLDIDYDSAFQWICIDLVDRGGGGCPEMPPGSVEIYDGANVEGAENKNFFSCSQLYQSRTIISNSILGVYNCMFVAIRDGNSPGGAICLMNSKPFVVGMSNRPVEIVNCSFERCASSAGGAAYIRSSAEPLRHVIKDCAFLSNEAGSSELGGGALYLSLATITVENCTFSLNKAGQNGGAILHEYAAGAASKCASCLGTTGLLGDDHFSVKIGGCIFDKCETSENGGGGAICMIIDNLIDDQISIQSNTFSNCRAAFGGGLYLRCIVESNSISVRSCLFKANEATRTKPSNDGLVGGSALFLDLLRGDVSECTFLNPKGKAGMIKVKSYPSAQKVKKPSNNEEKKTVLLENCAFDKNDRTLKQIDLAQGENVKVQTVVKNCSIIDLSGRESHHLDCSSIDRCGQIFSAEKAVKNPLKKFVEFQIEKRNFSMNSKLIIAVIIPAVFIVVITANFYVFKKF